MAVTCLVYAAGGICILVRTTWSPSNQTRFGSWADEPTQDVARTRRTGKPGPGPADRCQQLRRRVCRAQNRTLLDDALASVRQIFQEARDHLGGTLALIGREVDETAWIILRDGTPSKAKILAITRDLIYSDPSFLEAGVAFAPFAYHPRIRP